MHRVVVTGLGAITPLGNDVESTWQGLRDGRSGVGQITTFDASTFPVRIAGMVAGFDPRTHLPEPRAARHLHRGAQFAVAAAAQALADSGVAEGDYAPAEMGVSLGASVDRPQLQTFSDHFEIQRVSEGHTLQRAAPGSVMRTSQNVAVAEIARLAGAAGPVISVSTACTAAAHAIGEAHRRIQDGEAKLMLAGGADALTGWMDVLGFSLLGALAREYNDDPEHASRPFEKSRSGFVLGEGAMFAVLEERAAAVARGATILAEIAGYGASLNAYRMTDPPPDGSGALIAMRAALRESGLGTDEIDFIAAHGTGTPTGDTSETVAIKRLYGEDAHRLAVSSTKSMIGHTTAASAGINVIAVIKGMAEGVVTPTINLDEPDPELDLNYVPNVAQEREVRAAMINAFAFGGANASLVLVRGEG